MFDFAIITAPASRSRLTTKASLPVIMPFSDSDPAVVGMSIGLVVVLHEHRHAVHRPDRAGLPEAAIEIVGGLQRVRVDHHDRVQRGALLVVRVDAREVLLDERAAGQRAVAERGLDLRDGGFFERGTARGLAASVRDGESQRRRRERCACAVVYASGARRTDRRRWAG